MKEIYELFDSRLKKNKSALKKYAKSKGYKYYLECVIGELKIKSALKIRNDIISFGIEDPATVTNLWGLKYRIREEAAKDAKIDIPKSKECWVEGCKRKIADGNHAYCSYHDNQHKKLAQGHESLERHSGGSQYLF